MHISPLEEYGIRCALRLAQSYESGPLSASQIAQKEGLSTEYAGKIMHLFKKAGIVSSERGSQGGFRLTSDPQQTSLEQIFGALKPRKEVSQEFCSHFKGQSQVCVHHSDCSLRPVWGILSQYFEDILRAVSLRDLMARENEIKPHIQQVAADKARMIENQLKGISR